MGKDAIGFMQNTIRTKKRYAKKCMGIPKYNEIKVADRFGWEKKRELLWEIMQQIEICEELMRPLSEEDIRKLCAMETSSQILNYCRRIKIA